MPIVRIAAPSYSGTVILVTFWQHIQAREWDAARALLAPDFTAEWPHTGERFIGRDDFIAMNREYPEGWMLRVLDVVSDGESAASQIEVLHNGARHVAASFFHIENGLLKSVTEYWVQHGSEKQPEWRKKFTAPD